MIHSAVGISQRARSQLITLKRRTGILDDATLLRWALCVSLAMEETVYRPCSEPAVFEMPWYQLGGPYQEPLLAYLKKACLGARNARNLQTLFECAGFHVQRGIEHIFNHADIRSAEDLVKLIDLEMGGLNMTPPPAVERDS